jgi:protein TonB
VICVAFKLPGSDGTITATARIAWLNKSQKGGALQFIEVPAESRALLGNWLTSKRQSGNPTENRPAAAPGVAMRDLRPILATPLPTYRGKASANTSSAVAASSPIPKVSTNGAAKVTKLKDTPTFEPYVSTGSAKKPFRIAVLVSVLGILTIAAGVNLWPFRTILFRPRVSNHPAQPAAPTTPVPDVQLPLTTAPAVELSISPSPEASTEVAQRETRTATAPSRPVATPRARAPQVKPGKHPSAGIPAVLDGHSPFAPITTASSAPPVAPPNPISARSNELPTPEPAAAKNSAPALTIAQEPALPTGTVEIKSDPHLTVHMTPELQWRASWPGINATFGHLVSTVEPAYPKDALRQRIAGSVRLHVVVGRSGSVEKIEPTEGPALLAEAARRAIQQWHFEPTLVGGQPIEAEENIMIVFRLTNPSTVGN